MKLQLFTKRTIKVNGHDHVGLLNAQNDGKTLGANRDHIHEIKDGIMIEEKGHTHKFIEKKKRRY